MKLTKAQRDFFADLDLGKAIAAGEGKVHFDFTHKEHIVEVAVFCSCDADIVVKRKGKAGAALCPDTDLCLLNIPGTTNVSATVVLRTVRAEANKPEYSQLKKAWLDTPYVKRWHVFVREASTEFTTKTEEARYLIAVTESPDDGGDTVVKLFVSGAQIYTFSIPQPYRNDPTAQSLLNLAEAITEAWRYVVLDEYDEEDSK